MWNRLSKRLKFPYFFLTGWGLFWLLTWLLLLNGWSPRTWGNSLSELSQMTFSQMPSASRSGQIDVPLDWAAALGYDASRTWEAGEPPASFMRLGDFEEAFALQEMSFSESEQKSGQDLSGVPLSEFEPIASLTLGELVQAVPGLESARVSQLPLIAEVLGVNGYESYGTLGQLLSHEPQAQNLPLDSADLSQYRLSALPGVESVPLKEFSGWQQASISGVPGLDSVPFGSFPSYSVSTGGGVAQMDLVLDTVEHPATRTISGSYNEGFAVSCQQSCAQIELTGNPAVEGKQWISGQEQDVDGGYGALKAVFGGREPTGRHPFGKKWKVVVWDLDETTGTATTAWFFRVCKKFLGCTPYGFGPLPAQSYQEGDWIFLGP
jgi:hypothetical protein